MYIRTGGSRLPSISRTPRGFAGLTRSTNHFCKVHHGNCRATHIIEVQQHYRYYRRHCQVSLIFFLYIPVSVLCFVETSLIMASQGNSTASASSAQDFYTFANVVNGEPIRTGEIHHGVDPSTGEQLWPVPCATESILNHAVTAAQIAFRDWSQSSLETRRRVLAGICERLEANREQLTKLLMKEIGRPVKHRPFGFKSLSNSCLQPAFADLEVQHSIDFLHYHSMYIFYQVPAK